MLKTAFVPTADFESLAGGPTHNFVVGRRGAGKSALFLQLAPHFKKNPGHIVISEVPRESDVKGLIAALRVHFRDKGGYNAVRSFMRVVWRAVLLGHIGREFASRTHSDDPRLTKHLASSWLADTPTASALALTQRIPVQEDLDALIYSAARFSAVDALEEAVRDLLGEAGLRAIVLTDGLDEGWQPHELETAIVGGLCAAAIDLRDNTINVHALVFLRDNIFRLLGERDNDFSRNIAGDTLRLTWSHETLFDLVVRRLRQVFDHSGDNPTQIWNRFAKRDLEGRDGFKECLRYTLYRPRDVLELLNVALQISYRKGRRDLIREDIEQAGLEISRSRLGDLSKEYEGVFPGLKAYVEAFSGRSSIDTLGHVLAHLDATRSRLPPEAQKTFAKVRTSENVFQLLFGVGFLGIEQTGSGFQFCHDGTDIASRELSADTRVAVHPCYSRALDVRAAEGAAFDVLLAVNDEYDEDVGNKDEIGQAIGKGARVLIDALGQIPEGTKGAAEFEEWVLDAITLMFSGDLSNIELHPNKDAPQRRDVVGANEAKTGLWRRMQSAYSANQVIFEVKNFERLGAPEFAQAKAYTGGQYGRLVFVVYRSMRQAIDANERSYVQQFYAGRDAILMVLVPAYIMQLCLQKQVARDRPEYARKKFSWWVDRHERVFVSPSAGAKSETV